jgi:hypothetical protein
VPDRPLSSLNLGDVVAFKDREDEAYRGFYLNRLAVVLSFDRVIAMPITHDGIIYDNSRPRFYAVHDVLRSGAYRHRLHEHPNPSAAMFFERHELDQIELVVGFRALRLRNDKFFHTNGIFPNFIEYDTANEYEERWNSFLEDARPLDLLFTAKPRNIFSIMISSLDGIGPWSHGAVYIGDGKIVESVPWHGCTVRPINIYKRKNPLKDTIRLGLYRVCRHDYDPDNSIDVESMVSSERVGYSFVSSAIAGIETLLWRLTGHRYTPFNAVPNILLLEGSFFLVDHV